MPYMNHTYIRPPMGCTECTSSDAERRPAVAYQPREVGRYQSLPYALLCRFHRSAIAMQNTRRTKQNAERERQGFKYRETLVEYFTITEDIIRQEDARYAAEVKASEEKQAEQDARAAAADREYTRNAKRNGRERRADSEKRRFSGARVERTEHDDRNGKGVRFTVIAIVNDEPEQVAWVNVSLPGYSTWDRGKFSPSMVGYTESSDAWLYGANPAIAEAIAEALAEARTEADTLNAGWLK